MSTKPAAKKVSKPAAQKVAAKKAAPVKLPPHVPIIIRATDQKPSTAAKKATVTKAPTVEKAKTESKADKARAIFERMKTSARKDVLIAFQTEAGLTVAGSATYYANLKRQAEGK